MQVVVGLIVIVIAIALSPWLLPIAGLVWGVKTLRSSEHSGNTKRRGLAVASVVGSLAFAGAVWPGLGSGSEEEVVAEPAAATTPTASATTASPSPTVTAASPTAVPSTTPSELSETVSAASVSPSAGDAAVDAAVAAALVPVVGIVDGDTIKVSIDGRTERVRVIGIDTPELAGGECYAQQASSKMQSLAQSRSVRLEADPSQDDRDRYDRLLRHVFLDDGRSAAEVLIAGGFGREYTYAADYRYQSSYRAAEAAARAGDRGLWGSGCVDAPAVGTTAKSDSAPKPSPKPKASEKPTSADRPARVVADPPASSGKCNIKGNINSEGVKIYHVPGGRSYDKTKIDVSKGERWFCSTSEAETAGWRAARG